VCRFAGSLQIELNWGAEGGEREEKRQHVLYCTAERGE